MCDLPSFSIVRWHSSMVSPPQNCSKTVFLINPLTGRPMDSAKLVTFVPKLTSDGEPINLKRRYFSLSSPVDLSANAVAVSWKSNLNSLIKKIIYHRDTETRSLGE